MINPDPKPNTFTQDFAVTIAKRTARDYAMTALDPKASIPTFMQKPLKNLAERLNVFAQDSKPYYQQLGVRRYYCELKEGRQALIETAKDNFRDVRILPGSTIKSFLRDTVIKENIAALAEPATKNAFFTSLAKTGWLAWTVSDVINKGIHEYDQNHSLVSASQKLATEGLKSAISWEAGSIGSMVAAAAIPAIELMPAARIAGMALASVSSKHLLNQII